MYASDVFSYSNGKKQHCRSIWRNIPCYFPEAEEKQKVKFIFLIIIGVLVVFPVLNSFRTVAFTNVDVGSALKHSVLNMPQMWQHGDFDAYTMLIMSIDHNDRHGMTYGWQLFGALLFWWPRGLWPPFLPEKPGGSGHFMAKSRGWEFTNISCPLPGEGNINFGIIGGIAFGLIFGAMARSIDICYWKNPDNIYFSVIYPTLMFMFFFMSRGDLMSPLAYTVAFVAVWKFLL